MIAVAERPSGEIAVHGGSKSGLAGASTGLLVEARANVSAGSPVPEMTIEQLDLLIGRVRAAQLEYATFSQNQVDAIFRAAAMAANAARIPLAIMAASETGMGVAEDKVIKNHFASEFIYNKSLLSQRLNRHFV